MALPSILKNFNVFLDGTSYAGQAEEIQLPKLSRKMEEWSGGGMSGTVEIDMGLEALTLEQTYGGIIRGILDQWGLTRHDGAMIRFAGAYQAQDSDQVDAVEVVVRGRHKEIDPGSAKMGDKTAFKVVTAVSYYKLTINGADVIEIDVMGMIEKVNGVDRQTAIRTAIGM
ncbi:phage major tail tube protein [Massilia dura]|uniref:Phage major tail tube protein n=1 Tax=Pseudoduganella dura TaxID=321982 RepID=A0A6I3XCL2_9BURK|nr:phage major tail tube protein [Pseudoduganella dura]MUI10912.1 phage major tail tube protein [Pseudoduganella dura]GGY12834.1 major tail tube protein [Pseudoduganella dura]